MCEMLFQGRVEPTLIGVGLRPWRLDERPRHLGSRFKCRIRILRSELPQRECGDAIAREIALRALDDGSVRLHPGVAHPAGEGPVDFIATDILRVRNGRITDNWHLEDNLTFLQQIVVVAQ